MYEVINIATTTETYIANGIWTHNKTPCPTPQAGKIVYVPLVIGFEGNYVPAYPFTVNINLSDTSTSCARVELTSPASYTISSSPYATYITRTVSVRPYTADAATATYTLSATAVDANGKIANNNSSNSYGPYSFNCLTPDTVIELYTGKQKILRDIEIGDELLSINKLSLEYEKTVVTYKNTDSVKELYNINDGLLKCSNGHRHMIKRSGDWDVVESYALAVGDIMLTSNRTEIQISKIDIIK